MDPIQATAIALMIAREILSLIQNAKVTEQELALLIARNIITITGIQKTIEAEIEAYGSKP